MALIAHSIAQLIQSLVMVEHHQICLPINTMPGEIADFDNVVRVRRDD